MVNFDQIPDNNPYSLPDEGYYLFKITNTSMKQPKDENKKEYLNVQMTLVNSQGKRTGTFSDRFFDSNASALLYKLGRFVKALGLELEGDVSLKDLAKLLPGKEGVLEIEHQQDQRFPDDDSKKQAQVKLFGSECYWPTSQFKELTQGSEAAPESNEPVPFDIGEEKDDDGLPPPPPPENEY